MRKVIFLTNLMIVSSLFGMQGKNQTENTNNSERNSIVSVQKQNISITENYENFTNIDWVKKIIDMRKNGTDFNIPQNELNETFLMCATRYANDKILQQILNVKDAKGYKFADVNAKNSKGETALSIAVQQNDHKKMIILLTNGSDIELAKKTFSGGNKKNFDRFYEKVKDNSRLFWRYVLKNKSEEAESLFNEGYVNINYQADNVKNSTVLMVTVEANQVGWFRKLINKDVDVNIQNKDGFTALMYAAARGYTNIVKMFLDKGVDVDIKNNDGDTVLVIAAKQGYCEVVQLLLEQNNNINIKNKVFLTAAEAGHPEIVELLLNKGVNINIQNDDGYTALMLASMYGKENVIDKLFEFPKIEVDIQDKRGFTALIGAVLNGRINIVDRLIKEGANFNHKVKDGRSVLYEAVAVNYQDICARLLECQDIKVDSVDVLGTTPLMHAIVNGHNELFRMLLNKGANFNHKIDKVFHSKNQ